MTVVHLVRHAKPAATWGEAVDPGLDDLGKRQAAAAALLLDAKGRLPLFSSPLKRCRETAEPLSALWKTSAAILESVAEIPSPPLSMADKAKWLQGAMQGTWRQLHENAPPNSPNFLAWRDALLQSLCGLQNDCVIFSHYIAINVAVGAAQGHDRVISFKPGHASITTLEIVNGKIAIKELGNEVSDGVILMGR